MFCIRAVAAVRRYDFVAREREVAELRKLEVKDLVEAHAQFLAPESRHRARLAVHIAGKAQLADLIAAPPPGTLPLHLCLSSGMVSGEKCMAGNMDHRMLCLS